jgi:hypothetical protein
MKKMILDASIAVNTLLALISMQDVDRRLARCHFLGKVRGTLIWRAMWEFTYCILVRVDRLRHSVIFFCMNCTQSFNYMNEVC